MAPRITAETSSQRPRASTALSRVDVSIAYPMLSIGYVVNAFAAWALFGEALTLARLGGIGIIILGVFILARS